MSVPWVAVLPVKALATAKSRLGGRSAARRRALAEAFATDTLAALGAVDVVSVVTVICSDSQLAARLVGPRVTRLDEPSPGGLDAAVRAGVDWATAHRPDAGVLVVTADLPALRPRDVETLLRVAASHPRTVLGDREGLGTTMLTGMPGSPPRPQFGPGSLLRHRADGAVALDPTGLEHATRDVDTEEQLQQARTLGVGDATARVLRTFDNDDADGDVVRRQATVAAYDTATGSGRVLLDDGVSLALPAGVLDASPARLLRRGQRVVVELADASSDVPVVRLVHLITVPPGPAGSAASRPGEQPRAR